MAQIRIVTDSTCDLPRELVDKYRIKVVPLKVHFEDEVYREGVDLSAADFYRKMKNTAIIPRTSQPSPGDFVEAYREIAREGSAIISIHISSKLSGTLQSARMAAEMVSEADITVVDSEAVAMALGLIVLQAARAAEKGQSKEEILAGIEKDRRDFRAYFTVNTLEYLEKNGRIGRAASFLGMMLSIKPLLAIRDGLVTGWEKTRGRAKAIARIVELLKEDAGDRQVVASVVHGDCLEEAKELAGKVQEALNCQEMILTDIGPVVGSHTGPGIIGALFVPSRE